MAEYKHRKQTMKKWITALCLAAAIICSELTALTNETNEPVIVFEIVDARIDSETDFLIATLKVSTTNQQTVMFNAYDPEYELRLNGGECKPLGVTRWRHPFDLEDIKRLSGTNAWTRGYFCELTNISPRSVETVQFRMKRDGSGDSSILKWLQQKDVPHPEQYTNLWYGVAETKEYRIKQRTASNKGPEDTTRKLPAP